MYQVHVFVALLAVCPLSSPERLTAQDAKPTYQLVYKFRPNQFAHYDVTHKAMMRVQKGQVVQISDNLTRSRKHFRVVSVDRNGSAVLEPVLDRVRMTVRFDDNPPLEFDSANKKKKPHPAFAGVQASVSQPQARLKVSASGVLLRVLPLNGAVAVQPRKGKQQQSFLIVFPDKAIPIGHQWSEEPFEVQLSVAVGVRKIVKLKRRFELLSVKGDLATIESKVVMLTPVKAPKALMQLIQQRPKGTLVFDLKRGLIVSQNLTVDETVFGPIGNQSKVRAVTSLVETLVPAKAVAAVPLNPKN